MPGQVHAQEVGTTEAGHRVVRLAFELEPGPGEGAPAAPTRLHIVPAGPKVFSRDGRSFRLNDPAKVIASSELPMLVDWEHDSEWGRTKAAGWVGALEFVDGDKGAGIWGTVDTWTPDGERDVLSKTFRYLSPVLVIDAMTEEVVEVVSVALTNKPALRLEALDSFRAAMSRAGLSVTAPARSQNMPLKKLLCAALALGETVSDEELLAKVEEFKKSAAEREGAVSMQAYTAVVDERNSFKERCEAAEKRLLERDREAFSRRVESEVDRHISEGYLTPAEREAELARISSEQDLERAITAWSKRPKLAPAGVSSIEPPPAATSGGGSKSFTEDQRKHLKRIGLSEEAFHAVTTRQNKGN